MCELLCIQYYVKKKQKIYKKYQNLPRKHFNFYIHKNIQNQCNM